MLHQIIKLASKQQLEQLQTYFLFGTDAGEHSYVREECTEDPRFTT